MTHLAVDRSIGRQLLMMLAGIALVLTAIDVMWLHDLSGPPETNDDGALTSRGHAQRRQDILWSSVFLVTGGGALAFGAAGLARRRGVLELTDEGVRARVLSTSGYLDIPWSDVVSIRSGMDDTGNEIDDPLLIITLNDPVGYPHNLWGAEWRGDELRISAGAWSTPVEDVTVHASLLIERLQPAAVRPPTDDEEPSD